jgi:Tfp pilus assembly protein PilF
MRQHEIVEASSVEAPGQGSNAGLSIGIVYEPIPRPPIELALEAIAMGDCEKAKQQLEGVVEMEPTNDMAVGMLGAVYAELGQMGRAEKLFRATLVANPNNTTMRIQLGLVLSDTERAEEALDVWSAGSYGENQFLVDYYSGIALLRLGRRQEALEKFQKARSAMPVDHIHYSELLEDLIKSHH